jgi:hypothetical protein
MKVKTQIKAGGLSTNHNETLIGAAKGLKVQTHVKAGGLSNNHNEMLARRAVRQPKSR